MNGEKEHIELFEKYRNGDLSRSEIKDFEARLAYDWDFKKSFDEYLLVEEEIKLHFRQEMKAKLDALDLSLNHHTTKTFNFNGIKSKYWVISAVAALLVIAFLCYQHFFSSPNYKELVTAHWPYEEGLPVKMGNENKYDDAMNAFKLQRWEEAERLFDNYNSDTSIYFRGEIAYQRNLLDEAFNLFSDIQKNSSYHDEAQYRMALVLLAQGKVNEAKAKLTLVSKQSVSYKSEAKQLLKDLK